MKETCVALPKLCSYCDQKIPGNEFLEHASMCGSRTEKCQECSQYVRKADRIEHVTICETIRLSQQQE